jgi:alpha-glucosidase (family GH31 glycosyl hydrolase)
MVLAFILVSALSCNNIGKVKITTDENDFPVINLKNPFGRDIILYSPSAETGSMGVESEGIINWVKGLPEVNKTDKQSTEYTWTILSGGKFILSVAEKRNGYDLTMKTEGINVSEYLLNINSIDNEYFTGIFERVVDGPQTLSWREDITTALNLRGEKAAMKLMPTTSAYAPFYISSENYSFFAHGTWPGTFDFCKQYPDAVQITFEGPEFNVNLSVASTPKELVQKHALETGPSFIPPDWALGPWRWRDEHFNTGKYYDGTEAKTPFNPDLVEDVLLMKHYDIPATAYWIDRPWAKGYFGYEDFEFDTVKFPEPEKMVKWVNSHNMELMLWIAPFVCGEQAVYAKEKGYELIALTPDKRRPGMIPGRPMPGAMPERMRVNIFGGASSGSDTQGAMELIDFTNPEAARWWGENGPGKMAKMGIKGFKLDRADGEMELDSLHLLTDSGRSYHENYNDYPHQFIKATYDAVKPVLGNDFILFPRGVYTGVPGTGLCGPVTYEASLTLSGQH